MADAELKTSKDWYALSTGYVIMDPDGWDRTNYEYSFNQELISLADYKKRVGRSTVLLNRKQATLEEINAQIGSEPTAG
jgi:hypothetical protein